MYAQFLFLCADITDEFCLPTDASKLPPPEGEAMTPRRRTRKTSNPRRSSMGDDTQRPDIEDLQHVAGAAELIQSLELGSGSTDANKPKHEPTTPRCAPRAMSPPALNSPLTCSVPRRSRSGPTGEGAALLLLRVAGDCNAGSDDLSGEENAGVMLCCSDCGRRFTTLKALNKCNACYQSHWRRYG